MSEEHFRQQLLAALERVEHQLARIADGLDRAVGPLPPTGFPPAPAAQPAWMVDHWMADQPLSTATPVPAPPVAPPVKPVALDKDRPVPPDWMTR